MTARRILTRRTLIVLAVCAAGVLSTAPSAFAAAPQEPSAVTVETVKATEATFHGVLNPLLEGGPGSFEAGTYEFLYKKASPACAGESRAPASPAIALGAGMEPVSQLASGLTAGSEYTVCLLARTGTAGEETVGPPVTFTTATAPETPETTAASAVTATTAVLHGVINPVVEAETAWHFLYAPGGSCAAGSEAPGQPAALHPAKTPEETEVTGLEANREYTFCIVSANTAGEAAEGNELSFTTGPAAPKIDSQAASAVTSTGATLQAQVNPNNQPTTYGFEYSTSEAAGELTGTITTVEGAGPLEGGSDQAASVPTETLAPSTTYFYRAVAKNAQAETKGKPVQSFTTVPAPFTDAATAVSQTFAELHGHLAPLDATVPTQTHFNYRLGPECAGESATETHEAGTGGGELAETADVRELQPGHEYTVCFVTSNQYGAAEGPPVHFTTAPAPPRVFGEATSSLTSTTATLEGLINPNNQETTYAFEYASSETLLSEHKGTVLPGAGPLPGEFAELPVSENVTGLTPDTTYFFRLDAENAAHEKTEGPVGRFATQGPPLVTSGAVQGLTSFRATLTGTVDPGGLATTYRFLYVPAGLYEPAAAEPYAHGTASPTFNVGPDSTIHSVSFQTGELNPGETYDYTLEAPNELGENITAANQTFTTPAVAPRAGAIEPEGSPAPATPAAGAPPTLIPYETIGQIQAKEPKPTGSGKPTRKQLLEKALRKCQKKPKRQRPACRRAAKRRYR